MKVLFIVGTLGQGGAERQLYYYCSALKAENIKVKILSITKGEFWENKLKNDGFEVVNISKSNKILTTIFAIIVAYRFKPNIIQSQHFFMNLFASYLAKVLRVKSIGGIRNDLDAIFNNMGKDNANKNLFSTDYIIANSFSAIEQSISKGIEKDNIFYLQNAIDETLFKPPLCLPTYSKNEIRIIGIGRLIKQKRFDIFIDVINQLTIKYPDKRIKAFIYGEGEERSQLETKASNLGLLNKNLFLPGKIPNPEKFLSENDIFLLTSDHEGTPNVVLEAMSTGLIVIASNVNNIPFLIEDGVTGYLAKKGFVDSFIEKIDLLFVNYERNLQISKNARQFIIDNYSIYSLRKNILEIYKRVLSF
jgi:glycosyltransferase involved in cell wall biosynthesis